MNRSCTETVEKVKRVQINMNVRLTHKVYALIVSVRRRRREMLRSSALRARCM
jgi:hypothetical protein